MRVILVVMGAVAGVVITHAAAQTAPATAPSFTEGNSWTFKKKDGSMYSEKFLQQGADGTLVFEVTSQGGTRRISRTGALNPLDAERREIPMLRFPLAVGSSWDNVSTWKSSNGYGGKNSITYKVEAEEAVQINGEQLPAYRITANGWQQVTSHPSSQGDSKVKQTYWYVPSTRRIAKFEGSVVRSMGYGREVLWDEAYELTRFSLVTTN